MKDSQGKSRLEVLEQGPGLDVELIDAIISAYHDGGQTLLTPHRGNPVDVLVATILSQATSDVQSERAFQGLKRAFPTWEEVIEADPRDIEAAISNAGLGREKAKNIRDVLKRVRDDMGEIDLRKLGRLDPGEATEYLLSLPGVGPKTAACTLLFGFDVPVFPVDTHILRIVKRLGIIPPAMSAEKAQATLNEMIPPDRMLGLHVGLIEHGRKVCKKRKPQCEHCAISRWCARRGVQASGTH